MNESTKKLYAYALRLLSGKDIPQKIIEEKLLKKYPESKPDEISEIITLLQKEKFIDDERYCENFIYWRKETMPRGKNMICQELIRKKIKISLAQKKTEELISYTDEYDMCMQLAQRKWKRIEKNEPDKWKAKEKLFRFCASKMFSFPLINDVWEKIQESKEK